ncbi:hypothetical protein BN7_2159 [Wickerhamomyces ciferrii]|uniref:Probable endonuclease LCL3 n=1 Tax=Wickerhamomyces ciferrii (strain ATCC 14091 / BCRC 22168 / CBS 111 / JCM 3599 / NBRC 0793 / NRRL Y-1031 F-60-10) TaxID=1206466 RepID=K0KC16_WICCF|nr:uncharacterized protein BN7_2159 [Wickerhamomyces ciferrii]CCH42615.1 hypothetical protein BN7_2159 [Wickerhamomyces ciferrii]
MLTSSVFGGYKFYRRFLKPIKTVQNIPSSYFHKKKMLGKVTSVGDGDNFHFYHTPGGILGGWHWLRKTPQTNQKGLRSETLHVRLCGVDAPERSHFGKPAQPYSDEALGWLRSFILGKRVRVKPLALDQYGRVVGKATVWTLFGRKNVSLEMIKNGVGIVYEGKSSAEFDGDEMIFRENERRAKKARKGLWASKRKLQTPGEFKKQHRDS